MASSKTEVFNGAISDLRGNLIINLSQESQEARLCNQFFDQTLEEVLSRHTWNFAKAMKVLALLASPPAFKYTNAFKLPNDCIRPLSVNGLDKNYEQFGDNIYTNEGSAQLVYIAKVTDVTKWSAGFTSVFQARLASHVAYPLTSKRELASDMLLLYRERFNEATSINDLVGKQIEVDQDDWQQERY